MSAHTAGTLALATAALPVVAATGYLAVLAIAARRLVTHAPVTTMNFVVLVPAHNEETGIASTVRSLLALDYPRDRFRVLVVADNCTDATVLHATEAGALVMERHDSARRGKGYALAFAYAAVLGDGWAEGIVVVDADTIVSPNLLGDGAASLASGSECAQAEYGVRNTDDSWRTRLMSLAFTLHHTLRSLGRERLGLSCGLRGNGMMFRTQLLRRVPHESVALAEDVEYGIVLGLAGVRVAYLPHATVLGEMPATEAASRSQRDRWERGRRILAKQWTGPLLRASFGRVGRIPLDLLADLLVPPLVTLSGIVTIGYLLAVILWASGMVGATALQLWTLPVLFLLIYIGRGCALAPTGWRVLRDLLWVPAYVVWKVTLRLRGQSGNDWVRTARVPTPPTESAKD